MSDCGHLALIASGEGRGLCVLCQQAEIARLTHAYNTTESDRAQFARMLSENHAEIERLTQFLREAVLYDSQIIHMESWWRKARAALEHKP